MSVELERQSEASHIVAPSPPSGVETNGDAATNGNVASYPSRQAAGEDDSPRPSGFAGEQFPAGEIDYEGYRSMSSLAMVGFGAGVLSILSVLNTALGVVPFIGIVVSLRAIQSIRNRPDELTGGVFAKVGLALSILFMLASWGLAGYEYATEVPEGYTRASYSLLQPESEDSLTPPASAGVFDGQRVFIKGYVYPFTLTSEKQLKSFLLVRDNGTCCFGGTDPKPGDTIQVVLTDPLRIDYTPGQHKLAGTFHVNRNANYDTGQAWYYLEADYVDQLTAPRSTTANLAFGCLGAALLAMLAAGCGPSSVSGPSRSVADADVVDARPADPLPGEAMPADGLPSDAAQAEPAVTIETSRAAAPVRPAEAVTQDSAEPSPEGTEAVPEEIEQPTEDESTAADAAAGGTDEAEPEPPAPEPAPTPAPAPALSRARCGTSPSTRSSSRWRRTILGTPLITPEVEAVSGQPIRIRGFMLPTSIFTETGIRQFILVRDNLECCFGPGAALHDCIAVTMNPGKTANFSSRPVAVEGVFRVEVMPDPFDPEARPMAIYQMSADLVQ